MPPLLLPKTASKVPKFNELRSMVNYGEERKPLGPSFWKHLQAFRELFISPSGAHGSEFLKWKNQGHKDGLIQMADAYLDTEGNGEKFWPADRDAPEYNTLCYSRPVDHEFIKAIVVQIFFRLNRQQESNEKYKRKKTAHDDDPNRRHDARRSLSTKASSFTALSHPQNVKTEDYTAASFSLSTTAPSGPIDTALPASGSGQSKADPYVVPESPTAITHNDPFMSHDTGVEDNPFSLASHPLESEGVRSTGEKETGTEKSQQAPSCRKRRRGDDAPIYRNPPRLRKQPLRQSFMASPEAIEEACLSPQPSTESTTSDDNLDETPIRKHHGQKPIPSRRYTVPHGSESQDPPHLSSHSNVSDAVQDCPETSARKGTLPSNDVVEDESQTPRQWPPAPTVEDEIEHSSFTARHSSTKEPSHVEVDGDGISDPTRLPSQTNQTNSAFADLFSESESHWSAHPFENDQQSTPLENVSLPMHPGPTHPSAPVAVMGDTSMEIDWDVSKFSDPAYTEADAQCIPYQSTQLLEPKAQAPIELASDTKKTSPLPPDKSALESRPYFLDPPKTTGKPHDESKVSVAEQREQSVTAQSDTKQALNSGEPTGRPAAAAVNLKFSFILVFSRSPRWKAKEWVPNGKFLKKRLPELMRELPPGFADDAPGLMFRLISSGLRTEEPIPHGEDNTFDIMRKSFAAQIGRAVREQPTGETMSFRIEIEGLQADYLKADDEMMESEDENLC